MSMLTSTGEETVGFTGDLRVEGIFYLISPNLQTIHSYVSRAFSLLLQKSEASMGDLVGKQQCLSQSIISKVTLQMLRLSTSCL